jgi:hypothetical protein
MVRVCLVAGILVVLGGVGEHIAAADDEPGAVPKLVPAKADPAAPPPAAPEPTAADFSHRHQFGLSLRVAAGLRAIATYDNNDYCGGVDTTTTSHNAPVCTGRTPFSFDVEASYGVARKVDLIIEGRFAVESDFMASQTAMTSGPHPVRIAPGVRLFYSEGIHSKLFSTAQLVFDFTGYKDQAGASRGNDIGVRNINGLWYDLTHDYGIYGYFGEGMEFARWFDMELEVGVGFQARFGH